MKVRIIELGLSAPLTLSLILQHPRLLCYTTIEIDLTRHSIETRFKDHNDLHNPLVISEIVRRCHSIPVTLRALLAKYRVDSSATGGSVGGPGLKKRSPPSSGSGSGGGGNGSDGQSDMDNEGFESSKPPGGLSNGSGGSSGGSGGSSGSHNDFAGGMEQDNAHDNNNNNDDTEELHVTPRSLISYDQNGLVYATIPNRWVKKLIKKDTIKI